MTRERRKYFRCGAEFPVLLNRGGAELQTTAINVSSDGIALNTPTPLKPGERVRLTLFLPGHSHNPQGKGTGTVVWDDKHGKTGFCLEYRGPLDQQELDTWLDSRFRGLLLATAKQATPAQGAP
jgi:hypothetical protein